MVITGTELVSTRREYHGLMSRRFGKHLQRLKGMHAEETAECSIRLPAFVYSNDPRTSIDRVDRLSGVLSLAFRKVATINPYTESGGTTGYHL